MKCSNCNNLGRTASGYLDCTWCNSAAERIKLSGDMGLAITDAEWAMYQLGKQDGIKEYCGKYVYP